MQVQTEVGDRTELDGQPEEGQERIDLVHPFLLVGTRKRRCHKLAVLVAVQRFHAGDVEFDLAVFFQLAHLIDAVLRGAETVAVMDECQALGDWRQIDGPVQRAVAATGDQDVLAAKGFHLAHGVVHANAVALVLERLDSRHGWALGHEAAAARRDHDHRGDDLGAGIGGELPLAVRQPLQRRGHLAKMELRPEGLDLVEQAVRQVLPGDDRQTRNVVDRFFGIELGALPARPVEDVDQMRLEIEQP